MKIKIDKLELLCRACADGEFHIPEYPQKYSIEIEEKIVSISLPNSVWHKFECSNLQC